ncbi:MAG TPA: SDR family NAD(P)-dependent oxidoreductase [Candidatus Eisenbacteria bacterium]|nr:SDR family NAD(P)-dependent oxidoreductase [Candidatus Eisenbacteria bacterium]
MSSASNTALVTGGTGGLGRAVVARFLADGLKVAVPYRSEAEWTALSSAHPDSVRSGELHGFVADVTDESSMADAASRAASAMGGLRVLAHIAGGYRGGVDVESVDANDVRSMIEVNLLSAFWAAKHVIPHAKRTGSGRLLFVSSRGAIQYYPGAAAYAAAKIGLHGLVGTLAKELLADGVTANAVLPSTIDTAANRSAMPKGKFDDWVRPEQVAALLAFLASDAASAVSGALIPIYGRA